MSPVGGRCLCYFLWCFHEIGTLRSEASVVTVDSSDGWLISATVRSVTIHATSKARSMVRVCKVSWATRVVPEERLCCGCGLVDAGGGAVGGFF